MGLKLVQKIFRIAIINLTRRNKKLNKALLVFLLLLLGASAFSETIVLESKALHQRTLKEKNYQVSLTGSTISLIQATLEVGLFSGFEAGIIASKWEDANTTEAFVNYELSPEKGDRPGLLVGLNFIESQSFFSVKAGKYFSQFGFHSGIGYDVENESMYIDFHKHLNLGKKLPSNIIRGAIGKGGMGMEFGVNLLVAPNTFVDLSLNGFLEFIPLVGLTYRGSF